MTTVRLRAQPREGLGKGVARKIRASGRIPAVIYGPGRETRTLSLDAHEVERVFSGISVENTLLDVVIDLGGKSETLRSLVREVQVHPVRPEVLHVDFYAVAAGQTVEVEVPVKLVGVPVGVKTGGGNLEHILHAIEIECLPDHIPESIEVDVSNLEVWGSVHVRDLVVPDVVILEDPEATVCTVTLPQELPVEEEAAPAAEVAEPELIRRERAEEGEEAAGEEPARESTRESKRESGRESGRE